MKKRANATEPRQVRRALKRNAQLMFDRSRSVAYAANQDFTLIYVRTWCRKTIRNHDLRDASGFVACGGQVTLSVRKPFVVRNCFAAQSNDHRFKSLKDRWRPQAGFSVDESTTIAGVSAYQVAFIRHFAMPTFGPCGSQAANLRSGSETDV
jgi:hypothetical protein